MSTGKLYNSHSIDKSQQTDALVPFHQRHANRDNKKEPDSNDSDSGNDSDGQGHNNGQIERIEHDNRRYRMLWGAVLALLVV